MSDSAAATQLADLEHRYLELLVRAGEILSTALDWHETVGAVCDAVVETVANLCFLHLKDADGTLRLAATASARPELNEQLKEVDRFLHGPMRRTPFVRQVFERGKSVCVAEIDEDHLQSISVSDAHEVFMRRMNYRSIVGVPLETKTQGIIGVLILIRTDRTAERYDDRSLRFIEDLARRCATAIGKAMLYEQTLHVATTFQRAALPDQLPSLDSVSLDAFYEPSSQGLLVGGDWYDAFSLPDGRVALRSAMCWAMDWKRPCG